MYIKNIKIVSSFIIAGRGRAFETTLDFDMHKNNYNQGDNFRYQDKLYEIQSVQALYKRIDGVNKDVLCFIAKEISPKELFIKTFQPTHDPTFLKEIEWRVRNNWWLRHWKMIQIRFYFLKDKIVSLFKKGKS